MVLHGQASFHGVEALGAFAILDKPPHRTSGAFGNEKTAPEVPGKRSGSRSQHVESFATCAKSRGECRRRRGTNVGSRGNRFDERGPWAPGAREREHSCGGTGRGPRSRTGGARVELRTPAQAGRRPTKAFPRCDHPSRTLVSLPGTARVACQSRSVRSGSSRGCPWAVPRASAGASRSARGWPWRG